jgi:uncharacterized LabA/DUF88 family protein
VHDFAKKCLLETEELFRVYCYDCRPYAGTQTHPLSKVVTNFKGSKTYERREKFLRDLAMRDDIALREGDLSFDGWVLKRQATKDLIKTGRILNPEDLKPDLKQKMVDMKIGLDVAWLASKGIVDPGPNTPSFGVDFRGILSPYCLHHRLFFVGQIESV